MLNGKTILITGGTGSFGKKMVSKILENYKPHKLIIYSRDELKQFEMRQKFPVEKYPVIKYVIGDVRDKERLLRAFKEVNYVIHAAAMKQIPTAESNPFECIKTNVIGAQNIIEAALDNGVDKLVALSTDKACNPINLYGATKLASDKLFAAANNYKETYGTSFSVVRYGNVVGSRGSVIPYFIKQKETGVLTITHEEMTRFWITLEQGVNFVLMTMERMMGGELFVPKIPSMKVTDLAKAIAPDAELKIIGIRPGEKLHELMISADDARNTLEFDDYFIIQPALPWWDGIEYKKLNGGKAVKDDFAYASNINDRWLTIEELQDMIKDEKYIYTLRTT